MSQPFIDMIRSHDVASAEHLSWYVPALLRTARLALENETSGSEMLADRADAVERTLEVAEALSLIVLDGFEKQARSAESRDAIKQPLHRENAA